LNKSYDAGSDIDAVLDEAEHAVFEISENKIRPAFFYHQGDSKGYFQKHRRTLRKEGPHHWRSHGISKG